MRFIQFTHPEGGFQAVNADRITSVIYRRPAAVQSPSTCRVSASGSMVP